VPYNEGVRRALCAKMAGTLHDALALTKTPMGAPSAPAAAPSALDLPTADLDKILGYAGKANGGVDQFSVMLRRRNNAHGVETKPGGINSTNTHH